MSKKKEKKSIQKPTPMYKHSFGHYRTDKEGVIRLEELREKYPKKKLEMVREDRSTARWKRYCICEYWPENRVKEGSKKVKSGTKKG
mgnify:CR=1 FL=1